MNCEMGWGIDDVRYVTASVVWEDVVGYVAAFMVSEDDVSLWCLVFTFDTPGSMWVFEAEFIVVC